MSDTLLEAAQGRWPELLASLAGLTAEQLTDAHQPCPACGGTDRYRFDDRSGDGSWFCNQCGGKDRAGGGGNGLDLLMRVTGLSFQDACRRIEQHLQLPSAGPQKKPGKPYRQPQLPPADAPPPLLDRGAVAQWCYRDANGDQLFWVQRIKTSRGKAFLHRVWLDGAWHRPSRADGFTCHWPAPRPLLNLDAITARPDDHVLLVEGEKAVDAAARYFLRAVVTTWPNGAKATQYVDLSPLHGRSVILWPDADADGAAAMDRLAAALLPHAAKVRRVQLPADVPEGWDLADAEWSAAEAQAWLKANLFTVRLPEPEPEPLPEPEPVPEGQHFSCLGFDQDAYYYQPHSTGQVVRLSRSAHTGTNLVALAPLAYWDTLHPGKSGTNWVAAASELFTAQAAIGVYDPTRIRGRGAWRDGSRSILHLGDRLIVDGSDHPVARRLNASPYLYQRLRTLRGPAGTEPLSDPEALEIANIAERFHWEVPASGMLLAGWVTLAPIGGALDWRPHAWLTAAAGSGKSAILDRYVRVLLSDMGLIVSGNTTEAGIRQALRADALPVVFDEAESNEKSDQMRIQSILSLARVASSESHAQTLKGTPEGDAQRFSIRSMFLLSSIATGLRQGADKSRFAQLTLRSHHDIPKAERLAHWEQLDRDLERIITDDMARRLQARTVGLIPMIRQAVRTFTRAAAERFDSQRLGDQYGTLLAGAWSLQSSAPPTDEQARQMISQSEWEAYSQATEVPDERRCLVVILQHQIRVEAERVLTRSIGELVDIAAHHAGDHEISPSLAQATLGRHGLKVNDGSLMVSNTANAIAAILRDTAWVNCWPAMLLRLPGAQRAGCVRFGGAGAVSRAVCLPLEALEG